MRTTRSCLSCLVPLLTSLASFLAAQDPPPAGKEKPGVVADRIRQARQEMEEDRRSPANVQVRVQLRNKERLTGIIRSGRFVERRMGREFVRAEKDEPGAGMRIWFYNNTSSEIFILYSNILDYTVIRRLSDLELAEHGKRIRAEEEKAAAAARERAQARLQALKDRGRAEQDPEKEAEEQQRLEKEREAAERAALLQEFPPSEGWGAERIRQIETRKVVLGVFPSKQEARFLEVFERWQQALQDASKPPSPAPEPPAPAPEPSGRR